MKLSAGYTLILLAFALGGCTGPVIMGTDAGIIVATKGWGKRDADTKDQIPQHESWCYSTMGDTECYSQPQDVSPHRLVNVDPQSRYPLTPAAYHQAVAERNLPPAAVVVSTDSPTMLVTPTPVVVVDETSGKDIHQNPSPN